MDTNKKLIVGLTGPMAAGKNRIAEIFQEKGWHVIDADKKAHFALDQLKEKIVTEFATEAKKYGLSLLTETGMLHRKNLALIVFSSKKMLEKQEKLVYPEINKILAAEIDEHSQQNVLINAAMLYKSPLVNKCSAIVYVDAPFFVRLFRCRRRDLLPFLQIFKIFFQQNYLYAHYLKLNVDIYRVKNVGNFIPVKNKILTILSRICNC